jgi:SH3-like domain-containing protein
MIYCRYCFYQEKAMRPRYDRVTILIFALLTVLLFSPGLRLYAGEEPNAGPVVCNCEAFVVDTDPKGVNVRSGPGTDYAIVGTLPTNNLVEVTITGSVGPWMMIENAYIFAEQGMTEDIDKKIDGFVYGPLLAVRTQSNGRTLVPLYAEPSPGSRVVAELPMEIDVTLTGCRGTWIKVKHGQIEGWLDPASHCGNPVTTCP